MALEIKDKRIAEVVNFALTNGDEATIEAYPKINGETLNRYKREYRARFGDFERRAVVQKITDQYSMDELKSIAAGGIGTLGSKKAVVSREGTHVKFGVMTDTHIGSIYYRPEYFREALTIMEVEGCEFITHSGDITDGLSNRPDHIYELTHIGYKNQRDYAIEQMNQWSGKWYAISGNHDRYYIKSAGANIVEDIVEHLDDGVFLGDDEGDIIINDKIIKLWHGIDGSSYATSYRLQKVVESLTGGEKPHVMICGHTHKQGYFFERNIHVLSGGAMCLQSKFMRGKKLANHAGFHIVDMELTEDGVTRFRPEWFPYF